jgi:SAM-dependent methyltransferase
VLDVGCGPGHVARYLHERGVTVTGIDQSPEMVRLAVEHHPGVAFRVGDLTALDEPDGTAAGIVAFYSIIHLPRPAVPAALRELRRVLRPDGTLVVAVHAGEGTLHADSFLDEPVAVAATLFDPDELASLLTAAGFTVEQLVVRTPYEAEHPTPRLYAVARVSASDRRD